MIINEPDVQLDEAAGITLNNPLIGYHNVVTLTNVTAESEDPNFPATNLANPSTDSFWVAADESDQDVFVSGITQEIDYVGIANHNFSSGQVTVSILGDYEEFVAPFIPADDSPLFFRLTPRSDVEQMIIRLEPLYDPPFMSILQVGRLLYLPRRIYVGHTPLPLGRNTNVTNGYSEGGHFLGNIVVSETKSSRVTLQNLNPTWYRTYFDPFVEARDPFFWAWRPQSYPNEVGFAWVIGSPQPSNQRANGMMQIEMQINGITG